MQCQVCGNDMQESESTKVTLKGEVPNPSATKVEFCGPSFFLVDPVIFRSRLLSVHKGCVNLTEVQMEKLLNE